MRVLNTMGLAPQPTLLPVNTPAVNIPLPARPKLTADTFEPSTAATAQVRSGSNALGWFLTGFFGLGSAIFVNLPTSQEAGQVLQQTFIRGQDKSVVTEASLAIKAAIGK